MQLKLAGDLIVTELTTNDVIRAEAVSSFCSSQTLQIYREQH